MGDERFAAGSTPPTELTVGCMQHVLESDGLKPFDPQAGVGRSFGSLAPGNPSARDCISGAATVTQHSTCSERAPPEPPGGRGPLRVADAVVGCARGGNRDPVDRHPLVCVCVCVEVGGWTPVIRWRGEGPDPVNLEIGLAPR